MAYRLQNIVNHTLRSYPYLPASVQAHFLSDPYFAQDLRLNPNLDETLFSQELLRKLPYKARVNLVDHPIDHALIPGVLQARVPKIVHYYALTFNRPSTVEEARLYRDSIKDPRTLVVAYSTTRHLPALADVFGPYLPESYLLGYLIDSVNPDLSLLPRAISQHFTSPRSSSAWARLAQTLTDFFDIHPRGLARVLRSPSTEPYAPWLYLAAASSINLTPTLARKLLTGFAPARSPISAPTELINAIVANPVTSPKTLAMIARDPNLARSTRAYLTRRANLPIPEINPGFKDPSREVYEAVSWMMRAPSIFSPKITESNLTPRLHHLAWLPALVANAPKGAFTPFIASHRDPITRNSYHPEPINGYRLIDVLGPHRLSLLIATLNANAHPTTKLISATKDLISPKRLDPHPARVLPPLSSIRRSKSATRPEDILDIPVADYAVPPSSVGYTIVGELGEDLHRWDLFAEIVERACETHSELTLADALRLTKIVIPLAV